MAHAPKNTRMRFASTSGPCSLSRGRKATSAHPSQAEPAALIDCRGASCTDAMRLFTACIAKCHVAVWALQVVLTNPAYNASTSFGDRSAASLGTATGVSNSRIYFARVSLAMCTAAAHVRPIGRACRRNACTIGKRASASRTWLHCAGHSRSNCTPPPAANRPTHRTARPVARQRWLSLALWATVPWGRIHPHRSTLRLLCRLLLCAIGFCGTPVGVVIQREVLVGRVGRSRLCLARFVRPSLVEPCLDSLLSESVLGHCCLQPMVRALKDAQGRGWRIKHQRS